MPMKARLTDSLIRFFSLTYAVTWICFLAAIALAGGAGSFITAPLLLLGTVAPSLVALGIAARAEGIAGMQAELGRMFASMGTARWYLFAVGYMAAIKLAAAIVDRLISGSWPSFGTEPWYIIVVAIAFSTPVQAGEEIGWRGYALPRLAERLGLARASLLLGLIWGCWHLPLFFMPGVGQYGQSFPMFLGGTLALSVALAWLYANTNGSVLLTMLMHSALNQTVGMVPSAVPNATSPWTLNGSPVGWLTDVFLWITAAYFLIRMKRIPLSLAKTPLSGYRF